MHVKPCVGDVGAAVPGSGVISPCSQAFASSVTFPCVTGGVDLGTSYLWSSSRNWEGCFKVHEEKVWFCCLLFGWKLADEDGRRSQ